MSNLRIAGLVLFSIISTAFIVHQYHASPRPNGFVKPESEVLAAKASALNNNSDTSVTAPHKDKETSSNASSESEIKSSNSEQLIKAKARSKLRRNRTSFPTITPLYQRY